MTAFRLFGFDYGVESEASSIKAGMFDLVFRDDPADIFSFVDGFDLDLDYGAGRRRGYWRPW